MNIDIANLQVFQAYAVCIKIRIYFSNQTDFTCRLCSCIAEFECKRQINIGRQVSLSMTAGCSSRTLNTNCSTTFLFGGLGKVLCERQRLRT